MEQTASAEDGGDSENRYGAADVSTNHGES
jgi:hypothetical protein